MLRMPRPHRSEEAARASRVVAVGSLAIAGACAVLSVALAACGADDDHPPPAPTCSGCTMPAVPNPAQPPGGGFSGSTNGGASPGAEAGDAGAPTSTSDGGADTAVPQGGLGDASPVPPIGSDASPTTPTRP